MPPGVPRIHLQELNVMTRRIRRFLAKTFSADGAWAEEHLSLRQEDEIRLKWMHEAEAQAREVLVGLDFSMAWMSAKELGLEMALVNPTYILKDERLNCRACCLYDPLDDFLIGIILPGRLNRLFEPDTEIRVLGNGFDLRTTADNAICRLPSEIVFSKRTS
jgi:hypothetical protein